MSELDDWLDAGAARWVEDLKAKNPRAKGDSALKRKAPEMDAQKSVVAWLRAAGCIVSRNINELQSKERDPNKRARFWFAVQASGATPGFPDITAILPDGRSAYIEMKAPKGVVSDKQDAIHEKLRARGAVVVVGRDIWSVQAALAEHGITLDRKPRLGMAVPVTPLAQG